MAKKKLSNEKVEEGSTFPKAEEQKTTAEKNSNGFHAESKVRGLMKKVPEVQSPAKKAKKPAKEKAPPKQKALPAKKAPAAKETTEKKPKKVAEIKTPAKKASSTLNTISVEFRVRFHTKPGQDIFISGDHELLGNRDEARALPMQWLDNDHWSVTLQLPYNTPAFTYNYILRNSDGTVSYDWGSDKKFIAASYKNQNVLVVDSWNHAGFYENVFYTEPFREVLLGKINHSSKKAFVKHFTHEFKVKAPLLKKNQVICLLGNSEHLGSWNTSSPLFLNKNAEDDFWSIQLNLSKESFPIAYKYGVYDVENGTFVQYEDGRNRLLYNLAWKGETVIINDGFALLPNNTWKGSGIAIPVFSLRSSNSFGAGEFTDIELLVDWAKQTGLKLVQILPVNDTSATHTWKDSYPYASISAFALHPVYLNLDKATDTANKMLLKKYEERRKELNALEQVDYEAVINTKWEYIKELYPLQKEATFDSADFKAFFKTNKHWLLPYSVFCYLRDQYGTSDFSKWSDYSQYNETEVAELAKEGSAAYDEIAINYFVQYHLHLQLKQAARYAHKNKIVVKGDVAIGIYRYGADAWQQPHLFHMDAQAGAPPDDFAAKGQNWGFPTYNWERMREDGFTWWKQRFEQMSYYFDAFRIDHILGFFRIWTIPLHAVEGIMGHFVPAIPVHRNEFTEKNIWFDQLRYTRPYITDDVVWKIFGDKQDYVKSEFLDYDGFGNYVLKDAFDTQRKIEAHFAGWQNNAENKWLKESLFNLLSNVILFEEEGSNATRFHFRFAMQDTLSFKALEPYLQHQLDELYVNYFFRRQDNFWMKEALQKLPGLKKSTNMLICGEDLGLVPESVPHVMKDLGILSLEIQRMPKDPRKQFFHPAEAPYLSVVTPSTHDMSTIRGWWEEDRDVTQKFYNTQLGQTGEAPVFCEPWICKALILQHLYSPSMWSIFQLQDLLGMSAELRRENPHEERINIPSDPNHYWRYRMHLSLEQLVAAEQFNTELREYIHLTARD